MQIARPQAPGRGGSTTIQRHVQSTVIQLDGDGIFWKVIDGLKALARASTFDMVLQAVSLILDIVAYFANSVGTAVSSQVVVMVEVGAELYRSVKDLEEAGNDTTAIAEVWQRRYTAFGKFIAALASLIVSATGHVTAGVLVSQFGGKGLALIGRLAGTPAVYRAESSRLALLSSNII